MADTSLFLEMIENSIINSIPDLSAETSHISDMLLYSLSGGGKRIRPLLCLEFCKMAGGNPEKALKFATAVEYIHTYSLIHDDLPCMDNDEVRRGKPSSHIKFGEANALLAGDALLTHAFYLISDAAFSGDMDAKSCIKAVKELASLAGMKGMIGGQYIDLKYENTPANLAVLVEMDTLKTSALIESACVLGMIAGGADDVEISYARDFAKELGLSFQITDDVLEAEENEPSSDIKNGKVTYVSLFGVEKAKELAAIHTKNALEALSHFGKKSDDIKEIAEALLFRTN